MREGEICFFHDEALLASQLLAFCEGMLARFVVRNFVMILHRNLKTCWPLIQAQLQ
ncbi:hypothetical protein ACVXG7_28890 [Enterobacter hormaechei]